MAIRKSANKPRLHGNIPKSHLIEGIAVDSLKVQMYMELGIEVFFGLA